MPSPRRTTYRTTLHTNIRDYRPCADTPNAVLGPTMSTTQHISVTSSTQSTMSPITSCQTGVLYTTKLLPPETLTQNMTHIPITSHIAEQYEQPQVTTWQSKIQEGSSFRAVEADDMRKKWQGQQQQAMQHTVVEMEERRTRVPAAGGAKQINTRDSWGCTPAGLAMWMGDIDKVKTLQKQDPSLSLKAADTDWRRIEDERVGMNIIEVIDKTGICSPNEYCGLLHQATKKGYSSMTHKLVEDLKVNPDVPDKQGETPLFNTIRNHHHSCAELLKAAGATLMYVNRKKESTFDVAKENKNEIFIAMLQENMNRVNQKSYTPAYYAAEHFNSEGNSEPFDCLVRHSKKERVPCRANEKETLLEFYVKRGNYRQHRSIILRLLEGVKQWYPTQVDGERYLRELLGTREASCDALREFQDLYKPTSNQRYQQILEAVVFCILSIVISCLLIYDDISLIVDYHKGFSVKPWNGTSGKYTPEYKNENINVILTLVFRLLSSILVSVWINYVRITQKHDIFPCFKREKLGSFRRTVLRILVSLPLLAPVIACLENTYAEIKYLNMTAREKVDLKLDSTTDTFIPQDKDEKIGKHSDLKDETQKRIAIICVIEAAVGSGPRLILRMYNVFSCYTELDQIKDVSVGSLLSEPQSQSTYLTKQVFSAVVSLLALSNSLTSYHRGSKLGGLTLRNSLSLFFAIFFQVVSRAIACTVLTLAHTWMIAIVLTAHFLLVLILKFTLERFVQSCYMILGAIVSSFVYVRLKNPSANKKQQNPTSDIQMLFLMLAVFENLAMLVMGFIGLDKDKYDRTFIIISSGVCVASYFLGVMLQIVYYKVSGHQWNNLNGYSVDWDDNRRKLVLYRYQEEEKRIFWTIDNHFSIEHYKYEDGSEPRVSKCSLFSCWRNTEHTETPPEAAGSSEVLQFCWV